MQKEWFASWFDSPYYHTLYKNHDESDATQAIDHLLSAIALPPDARVLDLACGKGRHARYLAEKGFEVTGLDISRASIEFARKFESETLAFYQHDMRKAFRTNYFDAVMNFFTSFGYFETETEHLAALRNIALNLRPGGVLVLDFFNAEFVRRSLVRKAEKTVDSIVFQLTKSIRKGYVFKTVAFEFEGKRYRFKEKVRLFSLADFQKLFAAAGLEIRQIFGGHDLSAFDFETSKRLILVAENPRGIG